MAVFLISVTRIIYSNDINVRIIVQNSFYYFDAKIRESCEIYVRRLLKHILFYKNNNAFYHIFITDSNIWISLCQVFSIMYLSRVKNTIDVKEYDFTNWAIIDVRLIPWSHVNCQLNINIKTNISTYSIS